VSFRLITITLAASSNSAPRTGALCVGAVCGSLAHLVAEAGEDVVASAPSTRSSQVAETPSKPGSPLDRSCVPDGRRVYVRDAAPTSSHGLPSELLWRSSSVPGLSASTNLVESLRSQGLRLCHCSRRGPRDASGWDLLQPAASPLGAELHRRQPCSTIVCISGRVVVVAGGLEWLPALHFCMRNQAHVQGLLVVDPILPGFHQIDGLQEEAALGSAAAPSPLTAASMAIRQAVAAPSFALKILSFYPLHILEHSDHGFASPPLVLRQRSWCRAVQRCAHHHSC